MTFSKKLYFPATKRRTKNIHISVYSEFTRNSFSVSEQTPKVSCIQPENNVGNENS